MNEMNYRYELRIDESKRRTLGTTIKTDVNKCATRTIVKAMAIGGIILALLVATHFVLLAIDGAHAEWVHSLVLIVMGITGYITVAVVAEAREKRRIVSTGIDQLLQTGHMRNDKKSDERGFEEALEELYATGQPATSPKAQLLILAMYAPDHIVVNRPNAETSHATINYYAPSHHHMCFSVNREEFYKFYAKLDERTLGLA